MIDILFNEAPSLHGHVPGFPVLAAGAAFLLVAALLLMPLLAQALKNIGDKRKRSEYCRISAEKESDGIFLARAGVITFANKALSEMTGTPAARLAGKPLRELFDLASPDGENDCPEAGVELLQGRHEMRLLAAGRAFLPVEATVTRWEEKGVAVQRGSVRDIRERKERENRLARLASLPETNPNPVLQLDAEGRISYANKAALRLFPGIEGAGSAHPFLAETALFNGLLSADGHCSLVREIPLGGSWYRQELSRAAGDGYLQVCGYDITGRKRMEESVRRSEEEYRVLFETMLQGVLYQDGEGKIISSNPAARKILGLAPGGMKAEHCSRKAVHMDGSPLRDDEHPSMVALRTGKEVKGMVMGIPPEGRAEYRWLSVTAVPQFRPGQDRPCQVYTIFDDITERVKAERKLRESESRYRRLFESTRDGILLLDADTGAIIDANPSIVSLSGFSREELTGKKIGESGLFEEGDAAGIPAELLRQEYFRRENLTLKAKDGGLIEAELVSNVCPVGARKVIQCNIRDITERRQAERQIKYLSFHDRVTGLYNRTYFEEELRRLDTKRELPISLIMGDVNNLKLVNDAFGHREGDKLLMKIASILKASCRNEDIVARWGGDEFIILLPKTDGKTAQVIAQRIWDDCAAEKEKTFRPAIA
ncbi:MAG: sensor domain-containing diguanylate cyclase, partial [Endomicrobiales bacterium]